MQLLLKEKLTQFLPPAVPSGWVHRARQRFWSRAVKTADEIQQTGKKKNKETLQRYYLDDILVLSSVWSHDVCRVSLQFLRTRYMYNINIYLYRHNKPANIVIVQCVTTPAVTRDHLPVKVWAVFF